MFIPVSLQASGQKTLLQYFTPKSEKTKKSKKTTNPASKSDNHNNKPIEILLDSEEDEDDFRTPKRCRKSSAETTSSKCGLKVKARGKDKGRIASDSVASTSQSAPQEPDLQESTLAPEQCLTEVIDATDLELPELLPARKRKRARKSPEEKSSPARPPPDISTPGPQTYNVGSEPLLPEDSSRWSCCMCTFLNHSALTSCEMCSSPKVAKRSKSLRDSFSKSGKSQNLFLNSLGGGTPSRKLSVSSSPHPHTKSPSIVSSRRFVPKSEQDTNLRELSLDTESSDIESVTTETSSTTVCYDISEVCSIDRDDDLAVSDSGSPTMDSQDTVVADDFSFNEMAPDISWSESPPREAGHDIDTDAQMGSPMSNVIESSSTVGDLVISEFETQDSEQDVQAASPELDPDVVSQETAAAKDLFSGLQQAARFNAQPWNCPQCGLLNEEDIQDCEGCLTTRPQGEWDISTFCQSGMFSCDISVRS